MPIEGVRINDLHMTVGDAVLAMCGGNPGAMAACGELLRHGQAIDPMAFGKGFSNLLEFDTLKIYDERIYMLWNDVCGRDVGKMIGVLRAYQLGQLAGVTEEALNHAIDNRGRGLDLNRVMSEVKERLPSFNPDARALRDDPRAPPEHPLLSEGAGERDEKPRKRDHYDVVKV